MKPSEMFEVMDLACSVNEMGERFNPLFVGPPGIGKSQIVQQWCKKHGHDFIDMRLAYYDAPDMIGYPLIKEKNGRQVTSHITPELWPTEGKGVILLDELNRGQPSVMNTVMQLLTDRKINNYILPEGWFVVACVNPESEHDDVNVMGSALLNRFQVFKVEYDRTSIINYMKEKNFHETVVMFVETNTWRYSNPEDCKGPGAKYISPRDLEPLSNVLKSGKLTSQIEPVIYESILGKNYGTAFYAFKNKESPVTYTQLVENTTQAISQLEKFSNPKDLKSGHLAITIRDIVENKEITDDLLAKVLLAIPADFGMDLIRQLEYARKDDTILQRMVANYKKVGELLRETVRRK